MLNQETIVILTNIAGVLAAIVAILLGVSHFKKLNSKRTELLLLVFCIFFTVLYYTGNTYKDYYSLSTISIAQDKDNLPFQKVTYSYFQKEIENVANQKIEKANDYFNAAERDFQDENFRDAAQYYGKSLNIFPTMAAYLNMGLAFYFLSEYPQAQDAFESGLQISIKNNDKIYNAAYLNNIALLLLHNGEFEKALKYLVQALNINIEMKNNTFINNFENIGMYLYGNGRFDEALKVFQMAYEWSIEDGDYISEIRSLNNIAAIHLAKEENDKALACLKKALNNHNLSEDSALEAMILEKMGTVFESEQKLNESLHYYGKCLKIYEEQTNYLKQADLLLRIGSIYHDKDGIDAALPYYNKFVPLINKVEPTMEKADLLFLYGWACIKADDIELGIKILNDAREICSNLITNSDQALETIKTIDSMINEINKIMADGKKKL